MVLMSCNASCLWFRRLPNGPLARAIPSSAIYVANKSVNVSFESNKKTAKRGVYQKLSAEKKAEIGKRAAEHGVIGTVRYYTSKLPESLNERSVWTWKNVYTKEKQRLRKEGKDSTTIAWHGSTRMRMRI